jgi:hypothetical protein
MDLGPINRDHVGVDQTGLRTQRQHLTEHVGQRVLMALPKPGDGSVVGHLMRRDHAEGDVFLARALDRPRRPDPARIRSR